MAYSVKCDLQSVVQAVVLEAGGTCMHLPQARAAAPWWATKAVRRPDPGKAIMMSPEWAMKTGAESRDAEIEQAETSVLRPDEVGAGAGKGRSFRGVKGSGGGGSSGR